MAHFWCDVKAEKGRGADLVGCTAVEPAIVRGPAAGACPLSWSWSLSRRGVGPSCGSPAWVRLDVVDRSLMRVGGDGERERMGVVILSRPSGLNACRACRDAIDGQLSAEPLAKATARSHRRSRRSHQVDFAAQTSLYLRLSSRPVSTTPCSDELRPSSEWAFPPVVLDSSHQPHTRNHREPNSHVFSTPVTHSSRVAGQTAVFLPPRQGVPEQCHSGAAVHLARFRRPRRACPQLRHRWQLAGLRCAQGKVSRATVVWTSTEWAPC